MILADKIINERKKNGWSQEDLAEKLNVSRQAVSKWESAQSTPDLNRILKMAEIFGVSTDYLLKDEIEEAHNTGAYEAKDFETNDENYEKLPVRTVSMEEATRYMEVSQKVFGWIAKGVTICMLGVAILVGLCGLAIINPWNQPEVVYGTLGVVALLLFIAAAVIIFIRNGLALKEFDYLDRGVIETAYGVEGMVKEKKKAFYPKFVTCITIGVVLCIISVIPVVVAGFFDRTGFWAIMMVPVLIIIVAVAVNLFIYAVCRDGAYNKLLQIDDYAKDNRSSNKKVDAVMGIYWPLMAAIYLGTSFLTHRWNITWIIWPVAGVLCAVVVKVTKLIADE